MRVPQPAIGIKIFKVSVKVLSGVGMLKAFSLYQVMVSRD
jgi:hypothetical protein